MKKLQPPKNRKSVLVGVIVLAILTIVGLTLVSSVAVQQSKKSADTGRASVVNLEGESVCLPKKDTTGPQTEECASGIKVGEGIYYALANLEAQEAKAGSQPVSTGDTVIVSGHLIAPAGNGIYDIAGTVSVRSISIKQ